MQPSRMPDATPYRLTIPPRAEFVATARLFAATVARVFEVQDTTVEDLKLATSELVSLAILNGNDAPIVITITPGHPMTLSVGPLGVPSRSPATPSVAPLDVVHAVFSDVSVVADAVTITFGLEPTA